MSFLNKNQANTSSSTATSDTSIVNTDNRAAGDGAVFGGNVTVNPGDSPINSLNISTTDQGAVRAGLDATLESLKFASATQSSTISANSSLAKDLTSQAFDLAQQARQSETSGAINNLVKAAVVVVIVAVIAYAYVHRR